MTTKILVVTHRSFPTIGGLESHVYRVCKRLSESGDNYDILNLSFSPEGHRSETINKHFRIHQLRSLFFFSNSYPIPGPLSFLKVFYIARKFRPDIIHTHNRYMFSTWIALLIGFLTGTPTIHTEHASSANVFQSKTMTCISTILDKTIIRLLLSRCSVVTAVSQSAATFMKKEAYKGKILLTHNFLDTQDIESILKRKKDRDQKNNGRPKALFAGRLVYTKGYTKLLEFLSSRDNSLPVDFVVAGGGPGEKAIQNCVSKCDNLSYVGPLTHEDLIILMDSCDISINLSTLEGLSTVIMEAMYLNKVIICTHITPNIELLEKYPKAIFIPEKFTSKDLASALSKATGIMAEDNKIRDLSSIPLLDETLQEYKRAYSVVISGSI